MEYRQLGNSGLEVSVLGLGTNNFGMRCDEAQTAKVLDQAIETGVTLIDTANMYSAGKSEEFIGKALKGKRDRVLLATKFGLAMGKGPMTKGGSRKHMMDSVDASLKRLQTDYIDLYQVHFVDRRMPVEETLRALDDLVRVGKVRYIGASNYDAWHLCEAHWTAHQHSLNRFVSVQNHYSLLKRDLEREITPFCQAYGVGIIPFFPLESGLLTGKYERGQPPPEGTRMASSPYFAGVLTDHNFDIIEGLEKFAAERGRTIGELAIAGLLNQPAVIAGATKPEQVVSNAKGIDWKLSPEDLDELNKIVPSPYPTRQSP